MSLAFDAAKALHAEGRLREAADAYRRVPRTDPDRHRALSNLSLILEGEGRLEEALRLLDEAIQARADTPFLFCNRGRVLHRLGRLAEAIPDYERAIELSPGWVDPHHNLAMALEALGRPSQAESVFRRVLELEPQSHAAHRHLADSLYDAGRALEALPHYRALAELMPKDPGVHFDLAKTLTAVGALEESVRSYLRSLEIEPRSGPARQNLVSTLRQLGRREEARVVLEDWIGLAPADPVPRHMLAALTGEGVPRRAADETVKGLFDELAESFDTTVARLAYRAPQLVLAAVDRCYPGGGSLGDVLDAGCGTGLCGLLLRPLARRLVGVDLSPGMLARAQRRSVYDDLQAAELTGYLQAHPGSFDLIASSDTLNYFGALDDLMAAAALALRARGHLVFTLEREEETGAHPWRLQSNGRYSHSGPYLRKVVHDAGLKLISLEAGPLRAEGAEPVIGWVVAAQRG